MPVHSGGPLDADALYAGSTAAVRAYAGTDLVFGTPPTVTPTAGVVPFDVASAATRSAVDRKVFVIMWQGTFQMVVDHLPPQDWWEDYWLPPGGVEGSNNWNRDGGWVRDRKATTDAVGPTSGWASEAQITDNFETEIGYIIDSGAFDGAFTDWFIGYNTSTTGQARKKVLYLNAVENVGDAYYMTVPMVEGNASSTASVQAVVNTVDHEWDRGLPTWQIDGKWVMPVFYPEAAPQFARTGGLAFWQQCVSEIKSQTGRDVLFLPIYVDGFTSTAPTYNSLAYRHSRWGEVFMPQYSNTSTTAQFGTYNQATFGKPAMGFVVPRFDRPSYRDTWDSHGTRSLAGPWEAWIADRANIMSVMVLTWDDYSEGAQLCPSIYSDESWLDLTAYYSHWYKFGVQPEIVRDCIYLSNRRMIASDPSIVYSSGQTRFQTRRGSNPESNIIEARVFATAPATLELGVDSTIVKSTPVSAGISSVDIPAQYGTPFARLIRDGITVQRVESRVEITNRPVSQDMLYHCVSSLRQNPPPAVITPASGEIVTAGSATSISGTAGVQVHTCDTGFDVSSPYQYTLPGSLPDSGLLVLLVGCNKRSNTPTPSASGMTFTSIASIQPTSSESILTMFTAPVSSGDAGKTIGVTWSAYQRSAVFGAFIVTGSSGIGEFYTQKSEWSTSHTSNTGTAGDSGSIEVQAVICSRGDNTPSTGFNAPAWMDVYDEAHTSGIGNYQNSALLLGYDTTPLNSGTGVGGDSYSLTGGEAGAWCSIVFTVAP